MVRGGVEGKENKGVVDLKMYWTSVVDLMEVSDSSEGGDVEKCLSHLLPVIDAHPFTLILVIVYSFELIVRQVITSMSKEMQFIPITYGTQYRSYSKTQNATHLEAKITN